MGQDHGSCGSHDHLRRRGVVEFLDEGPLHNRPMTLSGPCGAADAGGTRQSSDRRATWQGGIEIIDSTWRSQPPPTRSCEPPAIRPSRSIMSQRSWRSRAPPSTRAGGTRAIYSTLSCPGGSAQNPPRAELYTQRWWSCSLKTSRSHRSSRAEPSHTYFSLHRIPPRVRPCLSALLARLRPGGQERSGARRLPSDVVSRLDGYGIEKVLASDAVGSRPSAC